MGRNSKRWRTSLRSQAAILLSLLPATTLAQSVALSSFAPRLINLSNSCQQVYNLPISGCTTTELDSRNPAHTCSQQCLAGLVQINGLVNKFCAQDDVSETSIVGLFKIGQAIQLLCNVAVVTTTPGVSGGGGGGGVIPTDTRNTFSSTMTMSSVLTSSVLSQTQSPTSPSARPTSNGMIGNSPIRPPPSSTSTTTSQISTDAPLSLPTSSGQSTGTPTTGLTGAALESLKSGNIGGGGGSPFDNIDNSEAASLRSVGRVLATLTGAVLLATFLSVG